MKKHPQQERSLVVLKPDAIQRSLIGEVIKRFERAGLKISAFKFFYPTEEMLFEHYNKDDAWFTIKGENMIKDLKAQGSEPEKSALEYGKDIIRLVIKGMQEGPVLAMVIEGNHAVGVVKKLVGPTEPTSSDVGTIRGDFTIDSYAHSTYENRSIRNLIHCSDPVEEVEREIALWFTEEEIQSYITAQERIMYDVNLDGKPD